MGEVILEECRLSYLNAAKSKPNKAGVPKYSASIMVPENNAATLALIKHAVKEAVEAAISGGELSPAQRSIVISPLRSGTQEYAVERKTADFNGFYFINAYSDNPPGLVDKNVQPILNPDELYSGIWANVAVNFYFTKKGGEPRVAVGLNHIMKLRDDDRLDGRTNVQDAFAKYVSNLTNKGQLT